jgi:hypothetical protein
LPAVVADATVFSVRLLPAIVFSALLIAGSSAKAEDCTLSEEEIMSLDYDMNSVLPYYVTWTAKLVSKKLIPGQGVEYEIRFSSTANNDTWLWQVSDPNHGKGTLASVDVSACEKLDLRFTLVSIDGFTNAAGILRVGSVTGVTPGTAWDTYRPERISLTDAYPNTTVASTVFNGSTNYVIGFVVHLDCDFSDRPHVVVLRVQPSDVRLVGTISPSPVGVVDFQGAPIDPALTEFLPQLTQKPVIVSMNVGGPIVYRSHPGATTEQILKGIRAQLKTRGYALTNMADVYFKLVPIAETNPLTDSPRIEVEVRDNMILVDGRPVPLESLAATITRSLTPATEVWVQDATHHSTERGNGYFMSVFVKLQTELRPNFRWGKIYKAYFPKGSGGWDTG